MEDTYRVSAIWDISSDSAYTGQNSAFFKRPEKQKPSFDFAPFFNDACDDLEEEARRPVSTMMNTVPIRFLQRA
ncbi:MAG: hypothetical protein K6F00_08915 [Lachnospiraceae bacterium]|nr:hypothetical protein [Lachnospiraceae bacterium]